MPDAYGKAQPQVRSGDGKGATMGFRSGRGTPGYPVPPEMLPEQDDKADRFFLGLKIPAEVADEIAIPGGEPPEKLHVTLFFCKGLSPEQKSAAVQVAQELLPFEPVRAKLGGVGRFSASETSDGKDVLYLSVDSADLTDLRARLTAKLAEVGVELTREHGFTPHMTLKYLEPSDPTPFRRVKPLEIELSELVGDLEPTPLREVWSERDPERLDMDVIHELLQKTAPLLEKNGIRLTSPFKALGGGGFGYAFLTVDGKVLKVTVDDTEAETMNFVKGKRLKHVVNVYDVFKFPEGLVKGDPAFGIFQERLEKLSNEERTEFNDLFTDLPGMASTFYSWGDVILNVRDSMRPEDAADFEESVKKLQLDQIWDELHSLNIKFADFHAANVMKRGSDYVMIDLGVGSQAPHAGPVRVIESESDDRVVETVIRELTEAPEGSEPGPTSWMKDISAEPPSGRIPLNSDDFTINVNEQFGRRVIKDFKNLLAQKRGINIDEKAEFLGVGTRGVTFLTRDGKALKITKDESEAQASAKVMSLQGLKHVVRVYDVFQFRKLPLYGILQERLYRILGSTGNAAVEGTPAGDLHSALHLLGRPVIDGASENSKNTTGFGDVLSVAGGDWERYKQITLDYLNKMLQGCDSDEERKYLKESFHKAFAIIKRFQIPQMVKELQSAGIKFIDYHSGNIMIRKPGEYVVIDLGYSKVQGAKKIDVLERLVRDLLEADSGVTAPVGRRGAARPANQPRSTSAPAAAGSPDFEFVQQDSDDEVSRANRDLARKTLLKFRQLLEKNGIELVSPQPIGAGTMGNAYDIDFEGRDDVLKVTADPTEARSSNHVASLKKKFQHIVQIYRVFQFPTDPAAGANAKAYGIVQEKLSKLNDNEKKDIDLINYSIQNKDNPQGSENLRRLVGQWNYDAWKSAVSDTYDQALATQIVAAAERVDLAGMLNDLRTAQVKFIDFHRGNIMKRGSQFVILDLGVSQSPGVDPPILEKLIREILSEGEVDTVSVTAGTYQPFHRGHADEVRELAHQSTKVVVILVKQQQGKGTPFAAETIEEMIRGSLVDVEDKLEVVAVDPSRSIPDVVSKMAADGDGPIKPDMAVNVVVNAQRFPEVERQVKLIEPEGDIAIVAKQLEGAQSDSDAGGVSAKDVISALSADDKEALKALVDPHLVSDPSEFDKVYDMMRTDMQAQEVTEAVLREFATSGGAMGGAPGSQQAGTRAGSSGWSAPMSKIDDPEEEKEDLWQNQFNPGKDMAPVVKGPEVLDQEKFC